MKAKILCSACLTFCNCRYDGSVINNKLIDALKPYVDFEMVCPEMAIGLPSPRETIRIVTTKGEKQLMSSYAGIDYTEKMNEFVDNYIEKLDVTNYDGVILKCKSPTCGIKDVKHYGSVGKTPMLQTKTSGFFGGALKSQFKSLVIEDEGRLNNIDIRNHFLTSVFLHYTLRNVSKKPSLLAGLVKFHSQNKYLLMAYNQNALKKLGKIVANHDHLKDEEVYLAYVEEMSSIYKSSLNPGKNINMLLHVYGYFKNDLNEDEKQFFLKQLEYYKEGFVGFDSILLLLKSWVIRFENAYLMEQTVFNTFPLELTAGND
ncbi:DUF523 and DUF1722 domain-containing protein [Fusibacter bizertensis]|uniref:DUF523 and DUF1722 domain-containing protein n=1 Tax=Fusibacter bizertensis TaxID=1488331 RepID=A0ABT6NBB5_9FIRM|nr:DUF523 and DUF1722 domain-containing protein [Fusibacter bizertensis]MDH8677712.1 DUF523 and DUF1722 domain-containing protein [Fusibacter bizertensis]